MKTTLARLDLSKVCVRSVDLHRPNKREVARFTVELYCEAMKLSSPTSFRARRR